MEFTWAVDENFQGYSNITYMFGEQTLMKNYVMFDIQTTETDQ